MKKFIAVIISVALLLSMCSLMVSADSNRNVSMNNNIVYKNLFSVSGNGSVVEKTEAKAQTVEKLSNGFDINETAFVAIAVYAPSAGDYNFKVNFSVSNTTDNANIAVKVGNTVKTISYNGTTGTNNFSLSLVKGVNTIMLFGATSEMAEATITYTDIIVDSSLYEIEGSYYVTGDANSDGKFDIRDLVAMKKYLVGKRDMNELCGDLNDDKNVDGLDLTIIRKCLLEVGDYLNIISLKYDLEAVNRDNEVSDNWEF